MLTHIEEGSDGLDQQVLQHGTGFRASGLGQGGAFAPVGQGVAEIGLGFQQEAIIPGLI